jgi:hypothetical protein
LPPVPFVEAVLASAWAAGGVPMVVAAMGLAFLFAPALQATAPIHSRACFAAVWGSALTASLIGPYPTPVLGFGGSAIVGYLLSVRLLTPGLSGAGLHTRLARRGESDATEDQLRFA